MGRRETRRAEVGLGGAVAGHAPVVWRYATGMTGSDEVADELTRATFRAEASEAEAAERDPRTAAPSRASLLGRCRALLLERPEAATPEPPVDAEGLRGRLAGGLAALARDDREAVLLVDVLGLDVEEAAEVCRDHPRRVRSHRHRAHVGLLEPMVGRAAEGACVRARGHLSDATSSPEAVAHDDHLAGCDACRTYADALDTLLHHAPDLVPPAPTGLPGQVAEDLGLPPPSELRPVAPRGGRWRWATMTRVSRAGVAAAVAGALVGLLIVLTLTAPPPGTGDDDADAAAVLTTVAETHAGRGTSYVFDLTGEVELRLPGTGITAGRRHLYAELERLAGGGVDGPGQPARVVLAYRAQGEVDGRGGATYELRWRAEGPVGVGGVLEVLTVDERTWVRPDGNPTWLLLDGSPGFDLGVAGVPHHLVEVVGLLEEIEEAGEFGIVDLGGQPVRHLRARTDRGLVVDAWVGEGDGWLRRLRWLPPAPADERDGTTHGELTARLREHGRSVFLGVPDDWVEVDEIPDGARPPFLPRDG